VEPILKKIPEKNLPEFYPIMTLTKSKYPVEARKIVIFGAGKIGRSFIGQLFGCNGYKVIFIDIDPVIVNLLNKRGNYRVLIKGDNLEEIVVPDVGAVSALDSEKVVCEVASAGIMAVSVGKNALEKVIPVISGGLIKRSVESPGIPLDIILAENMRSAADFVREQLKKNLPSSFSVESLVGLIETSIGKMVPIMPLAELEKDPLMVFAEPYNTLILDRKGFKSKIPEIKGLAPKNNIKAWVDRKAFIHNLGHATAAYYGYSRHPDAVYMYEVLDDPDVLQFTRNVMLQSADILKTIYQDDFTAADLEDHIDDLIFRFRNKALQDTVFRVGQDLSRKLNSDDRFMGAIHLAMQCRKPYNLILLAMSYGLFFRAKDETGKCFPSDIVFLNSVDTDFELSMTSILGLDPLLDDNVIKTLKELYDSSRNLG
jgi:mannitol-1-phosphate 5-dehydrogenase